MSSAKLDGHPPWMEGEYVDSLMDDGTAVVAHLRSVATHRSNLVHCELALSIGQRK
jgi:hypothetical protein